MDRGDSIAGRWTAAAIAAAVLDRALARVDVRACRGWREDKIGQQSGGRERVEMGRLRPQVNYKEI